MQTPTPSLNRQEASNYMQSIKHYLRFQITAALMAILFSGLPADASHRDFYVAEHTDFSSCGGSDLNAITPQFVDYLRDHGWTGTWFMEGNAWPQDLKEDALGGIDQFWGDARNLSAYAGHGFTDARRGLSYGTPHNGKCRLDIDQEMRLGERVSWGGNGQASFFFSMTSCTVHLPKVPQVWFPAAVGLAQVFGFHDSPRINDDEPRLFLQSVRGSSSRNNKTEWLNRMDNCGPWYWFCSNSPIVLSFGENRTQAQDIHNTANLWYRHTNPWIDGPNHLFYSYINNGSGPCF